MSLKSLDHQHLYYYTSWTPPVFLKHDRDDGCLMFCTKSHLTATGRCNTRVIHEEGQELPHAKTDSSAVRFSFPPS